MIGVMCGSIDESSHQSRDFVIPVMDGDGPKIYEKKQEYEGSFLHREEEDIDMIREALQEPVNGMESVACKGGGNLPPVMRLVDILIKPTVVKPSVYPIDPHVREQQEGRYAHQEEGQASWVVFYSIVEL